MTRERAASAGQTSNSWNTNPYTGYCGSGGLRTGGYVVAIQQYERSRGSNLDEIDNYWGPRSDAGLKGLQSYYRISADGCAGPQTWSYMRNSIRARCSPGYACPNPMYVVYLGREYQYFHKAAANCDWSSYTNVNPVAGPVRQRTHYGFTTTLTGPSCNV